MAYPALKKFSYLGQFGVLAGFVGAGIIVGIVASMIPLLGSMSMEDLRGGSSSDMMESLFRPENAGLLRLIQFITTLFVFFIPAVAYAWLCHNKAFTHLGYKKKTSLAQIFTIVLLTMACLPLVGVLGELTEKLPLSEATLEKFKQAEEEYYRQVEVIGRMNNFPDYLVSLVMMAILPALFEETLFRGGVQNLLSRWFRMPILAIIITSILFSLVHFSYIGFLSRAVLGFVLGWLYHRTGNLWLSIIMHVTNNAIAITALYVLKLRDPNLKISDAGPEFPIWTGAASLLAIFFLLRIFENTSKHQVDRPGMEVSIYEETDRDLTARTMNNI